MTETTQAPAAEPETTGDMPQSYYDSIKARFAEARDLRLKYRPEGTAQYTSDLTGELAKYAIDPHAEPAPDRDADHRQVEVLFIGGGFSALLTAARLRERGRREHPHRRARRRRRRHLVLEPLSGRGLRRAVSYDYLPLLDEMDYVPSRLYAKGPEIFAHCQAIAKRYDLYDLAVFRTTVLTTTWDDAEKLWLIEHRPRRPDAGQVRDLRQRHALQAEAVEDRRHGELRGPLVPHLALGLRLHRRGLCRTSRTRWSASSAPAPRRCRRSRASARRPRRSTSSSARRRASTSAATGRPIRNGRRG